MGNPEVIELITTDDFYKQFIDQSKKKDFQSEIIQGLTVGEQLKKLADGITLLDKELQTQVLANHEDLLSQATWVEKLEGVLSLMQSHVQCLLTTVERVRTKIVEPYTKVEMQTQMLSRLHATSDILRRVARIKHITKRLCHQMKTDSGLSDDTVKASQSLNELVHLSEDVDLSGLDILGEDQHVIQQYQSEVEKQAKIAMNQGLLKQNFNQVGIAVQVFYNLNGLDAQISQVIEISTQTVINGIDEALDVQMLTETTIDATKQRGGPGRAAMPTPGNTSVFRTRLWSALEHLFDSTIYTECYKMALLQRVLMCKVRDLNLVSQHQNTRYIDLLPNSKHKLAEGFWKTVSSLLTKKISQSANSSSFLKQALEGEYPKFLRLYIDMCKHLQNSTRQLNQVESSTLGEPEESVTFAINRDVVVSFENAYLSRSVSRLLDPVNLMFSGESVPPNEEVDSLIRIITSELSVSLVDDSLSCIVAKNVSKTVRLFCLKCEQMVVNGGEATQVIDSCTSGQITNIGIVNLLYYLSGQVNRVITNMKNSLTDEAVNIILDSLNSLDKQSINIINPLLASISDAVEAIILTIHNEDYSMASCSDASKKNENQSSLYMKELHGFIHRAVNTYLVPFHNQDLVYKCCIPVACRCVELFLRHTALVRPIGDGGRMKLLADYSQMESAVAPLCRQLPDLGLQYRIMRSFKPMVNMPVEEIVNSSALGEVIPYSLVLLSLFAYGPRELLSPHQSANWSVSRFSQWLDAHPSEFERLEMMGGALQRYQQTISQKGAAKFHVIYPLMLNVLEKGMASAKK